MPQDDSVNEGVRNHSVLDRRRRPPPPERVKIVGWDHTVVFPDSVWHIHISSELAEAIIGDGYAVMIHTFRDKFTIPSIGTLAGVSQHAKNLTKRSYRITFFGIARVKILEYAYVRTPNDATLWEARCAPVPHTIISPEVWSGESCKADVALFHSASYKLYDMFNEGWEAMNQETAETGSEDRQNLLRFKKNLDDFRALTVSLRTATPHNIEFLINRILDVVLRFLFTSREELPRDVLIALRENLWTIGSRERLEKAAQLAASLFLHTENIIGDETKESTTPEPAEDSLIQAELSKPREIPPPPERVSKDPPEGEWTRLDLGRRGPLLEKGLIFVGQRMVNQRLAAEQCFRVLSLVGSGLSDPEVPEILGFFCGPTGVGKTELIKTVAQFLFGDRNGYTHIEGNTLTQEHSVARLIGAEPGYIGYDEEGKISQWRLDRPHVLKILRDTYHGRPDELRRIVEEMRVLESQLNQSWRERARGGQPPAVSKERLMVITGWQPGKHLAIILFDESEKVHRNVQYYLLGVLNEGAIELASGERIMVHNALFAFTSNVYGREIAQKILGKGVMGIRRTREETEEDYKRMVDEIYHETLGTLEKEVLIPELLGRIGKERVRVLYPFSATDIREILEVIQLPQLAARLMGRNIELHISEAAIAFLQKEVFDSTNRALGARAVRSVVQRKVTEEIANQCSIGGDGGIASGDIIVVDVEDKDDGGGLRIVIKKLIKRGSNS